MQIGSKSGGMIVAGYVHKDAEFKLVGDKGTAKTTFSINAGKNADGQTVYVNCVAWRALAHYAAEITRGCHALVAGVTEEREYNGKTYRDLVADFINFVPAYDGHQEAAENARDIARMQPVLDDKLPF